LEVEHSTRKNWFTYSSNHYNQTIKILKLDVQEYNNVAQTSCMIRYIIIQCMQLKENKHEIDIKPSESSIDYVCIKSSNTKSTSMKHRHSSDWACPVSDMRWCLTPRTPTLMITFNYVIFLNYYRCRRVRCMCIKT
jgi:hypothetical protein